MRRPNLAARLAATAALAALLLPAGAAERAEQDSAPPTHGLETLVVALQAAPTERMLDGTVEAVSHVDQAQVSTATTSTSRTAVACASHPRAVLFSVDSRHLRTSKQDPAEDEPADVGWTLALAGGEGVRLTEYVERRFGQLIPKQYCCLLGERSMLQHTLERLNKLTPPSRTITVIGTNHGELAYPQLRGKSDHVLRQPASRDTGLALYVALAMIKRWSPNALVTITPTEHYVAPAAAYVEQVRAARGVAVHPAIRPARTGQGRDPGGDIRQMSAIPG